MGLEFFLITRVRVNTQLFSFRVVSTSRKSAVVQIRCTGGSGQVVGFAKCANGSWALARASKKTKKNKRKQGYKDFRNLAAKKC